MRRSWLDRSRNYRDSDFGNDDKSAKKWMKKHLKKKIKFNLNKIFNKITGVDSEV